MFRLESAGVLNHIAFAVSGEPMSVPRLRAWVKAARATEAREGQDADEDDFFKEALSLIEEGGGGMGL